MLSLSLFSSLFRVLPSPRSIFVPAVYEPDKKKNKRCWPAGRTDGRFLYKKKSGGGSTLWLTPENAARHAKARRTRKRKIVPPDESFGALNFFGAKAHFNYLLDITGRCMFFLLKDVDVEIRFQSLLLWIHSSSLTTKVAKNGPFFYFKKLGPFELGEELLTRLADNCAPESWAAAAARRLITWQEQCVIIVKQPKKKKRKIHHNHIYPPGWNSSTKEEEEEEIVSCNNSNRFFLGTGKKIASRHDLN